ncbi:hypothetical protein ALC56_14337 [Trachymyrmex septentrionalis]|uniref:Direct IAP-binding protein with low pI n=1 Tax=Trachymyrmex septentrionalis TaxID=34720 RepID=A0A195ETH1_9HYME|nr:PREDICTED: uncharacterized protein LOC108755305 [Trachymyrmex septentrionalis]KYN31456.1 hypothetical protein ALC56_14337 [Trachymyrmex septentrionalis]
MAMRQIFTKLWKNISPVMYTSGILFAHCTSFDKPSENKKLKLDPPDIKKLTHECMIKQSALDAANSATQALTVTYMAIIDLSVAYRILLNELISLLEETIIHNVNDAHWDMIVEVRNEMQDKKEKLTRLVIYMDYVHKMAVASAELSYMCEMDSLTSTLQQRIEDALSKVKMETDSNTELERTYWRIQEQCIKGSKENIKKQ